MDREAVFRVINFSTAIFFGFREWIYGEVFIDFG